MFKLFLATLVISMSPYARGNEAKFQSWDEACLAAEAVVREGDLVFLDIPNFLFRKVAEASGSWTSHVGIVFKNSDGRWAVAESKVPISKETPLCDFIRRSSKYRFEITRFHRELSKEETATLHSTAHGLLDRFYNLGFNLESRRLFCSKFVYLTFQSIGVEVGRVQTFRELLNANPDVPQSFWRFWFLGSIPWNRKTVTPASQLDDPKFYSVLKGL